ncbi:MAG: 16S rRNA (cytosine(1402)-N(4))-methyltransferase, partial [Flavitalea sp.]
VFFRKGTFEDSSEESDVYGTPSSVSELDPVNKKPIVPGEKEQRDNPRSRSAKMRVARKKE